MKGSSGATDSSKYEPQTAVVIPGRTGADKDIQCIVNEDWYRTETKTAADK